MNWYVRRLFAPIDIASLVYFRIVFGLIMVWQVWRYLVGNRMRSYYIRPDFHFKYYGFDWVHPLPGDGMNWALVFIGVCALFVMIGLFYRISAILLFLSFTYLFLLDQAQYLNHYYLVCLIAFLMIFLPVHKNRSLDARIWPSIRSDTVPAWTLWILMAQLGIVYFYAGVAKMNADWLRGEPMRMWLGERDHYPLIGPMFTQEWCIMMFSYGGLLFDLLVPFGLLWRRTRLLAFTFSLFFHLMNASLFNIGMFPWFALAATMLFFDPDWPRKQNFLMPPIDKPVPPVSTAEVPPIRTMSQKLVVAFFIGWVALQILVPLRHFLYPGTVHWTEEGHRFAWHMKLRDKSAKATFIVTDVDTGRSWNEDPDDLLTARQVRKMSGRPDMILQFAHHLQDVLREEGHENVEIRVVSRCSLNGRKRQLLIDPEVDLTKIERSLGISDWIIPLTTPLWEDEKDGES